MRSLLFSFVLLCGSGVLAVPEITILSRNADQEMSFDFGDVPVGQTYVASFELKAPAQNAIEIISIEVGGDMYSGATNCPSVLPAGQACLTEAYFSPTVEGQHEGVLVFNMRGERVIIYLTGRGVAATSPEPEPNPSPHPQPQPKSGSRLLDRIH